MRKSDPKEIQVRLSPEATAIVLRRAKNENRSRCQEASYIIENAGTDDWISQRVGVIDGKTASSK